MDMMRHYRIICLKRSTANTEDGYFRWDKRTYWRPDRSGYTTRRGVAGVYSAKDIQNIGGCEGDWVLQPVTVKELRFYNGLPPLTGREPFEMPEGYF